MKRVEVILPSPFWRTLLAVEVRPGWTFAACFHWTHLMVGLEFNPGQVAVVFGPLILVFVKTRDA